MSAILSEPKCQPCSGDCNQGRLCRTIQEPEAVNWSMRHGMHTRNTLVPHNVSTIPTKRTLGQRIRRAIALWALRSDLESNERYLRDAERVGLMSEAERDGFRRYCQELRVRIAAWEFK